MANNRSALADTVERSASGRRQREIIKNGLTKGHLKVLNEELILEQQRNNNETVLDPGEVLRIEMSYNSVQILHQQSLMQCCKLALCNLRGCYVANIKAFQGCSNLLKLDLANNQISTLPGDDFWRTLSSLKVLYLNGNALYSLQDLASLGSSPSLLVLTLSDTPLALDHNYRHHVANSIYRLKALDGFVISDEEIIENLRLPQKFSAMGSNMKLQLYTPTKPGTSVRDEVHQVFSLLLTVDRILAKYSPVTIIQRYFRGWFLRLRLARDSNYHIRILVKKHIPHRPVLIKKAIRAPPSTPLSQPQKKVSFSLQVTPHATRMYLDVHPSQSTGSLARTRLPAMMQGRDATASARALMLRAYPSHGFSTTAYTTATKFRNKIRSVTDLGEAEGVWVERPTRRGKMSGGRMKRRKSLEGQQVVQQTELSNAPIEIQTGLSKDEQQDNESEEKLHAVEIYHDKVKEVMEIKPEDAAVEDVFVRGMPPHKLKEGTSYKEPPEVLAKQHKELKEAAKAAKSKPRDEASLRTVKKLDSSEELTNSKCPFSLRAIRMVDNYHAQMQSRQEQEQKNCLVAHHYLERSARQDSIREAMNKRRQKLAEWAGDHWDLVACRAEEAECELQMLQDQVAILRHQHQLYLQKERANVEATIRAMQKFTMLDNRIKKTKNIACREASLASLQEDVSQRQADWEAEKEENKLIEMKTHAKLLAKSRHDKKKLHKLHVQKISSHTIEKRNKVLEGKEKREMSSKSREKSKEDILAERLRDIPKPFVLQSDNVPAMGFGVSRVARIPRPLQRTSTKRVSFVMDSKVSSDLMAYGSQSLPVQKDQVLVSLPRKYFKSPPETPFTELNSTSTI